VRQVQPGTLTPCARAIQIVNSLIHRVRFSLHLTYLAVAPCPAAVLRVPCPAAGRPCPAAGPCPADHPFPADHPCPAADPYPAALRASPAPPASLPHGQAAQQTGGTRAVSSQAQERSAQERWQERGGASSEGAAVWLAPISAEHAREGSWWQQLTIICPGPAPPTPATGPAKPGAAAPIEAAGTPRPAGAPRPTPPAAAAETVLLSANGGGPSTDSDTTFSPRISTRSSARFSSLSSEPLPLPEMRRNSSVSASTRFMCLSNARNFPTSMRVSESVTRIR